ncbi:stress adaptor protein CpxP [Rouxiella silvae]|uniref:Cell-envelope stress modulator CpxP n=1 Tax=Rouxiella silvae TaxID=1646373 RepID=A0AA40X715_9GAMM|nr:cell-envelope stress modulator CpxP [Rouxiella silvae]MBF6639544.1 cell-envelope stress modulator CpxP [Rouxiella silvae]ORJ22808.1 stress adaptor protein CpxP [Rouxiella silvae]
MCKVAAMIMASMLALSSSVALAESAKSMPADTLAHDGNMLDRRNTMFDGINLTEQQRQQMRDLMHQARKDSPQINLKQMETMHELVTAENFDQAAVRAQAEKIAQEQVDRQVEMARIRNLMFNLLTPQQKEILNQKHEQRMQVLATQISGLQPTSTQKPVISTQ